MKHIQRKDIGKRVLILCLVLICCFQCKEKDESQSADRLEKHINEGNQMNPTVSIVEIPMKQVEKSISFYETIFQVKIERMKMMDTELGVFPSDGKSVSIVLTKGPGYLPKSDGVLVYLNAGDDLQPILRLVEENGGKVLLTKTEISPEMGYYALFLDPEGNRIGLHSLK